MIYGYARVSTKKQCLDRQLDSLMKYVDKKNIYTDKYTGTKFDRKGYIGLKDVLVSGDEVYIHALDRLGRNKEIMKNEIIWFKEKGVTLRILNVPTTLIETEGQEWIFDMVNNLLIEVLASVAEAENEERRAKINEGIESAKKRGVKFGRPDVKVKVDEVIKMVNNGSKVTEACRKVGIGKRTYYNYVSG